MASSKNKELSVIHERIPVNTSEVRHFHHQASQFFCVLSGTATLEGIPKMGQPYRNKSIQ